MRFNFHDKKNDIHLPLACYFSVKLPEGGVENPPADTGRVLERMNPNRKFCSDYKVSSQPQNTVLGRRVTWVPDLFPIPQMLQILWSTP